MPADVEWFIRVDGHSDNVPIQSGRFASNWELSLARALAVVRYLVSRGVPPERLSANGFGEYQPLDNADTREAHRRNRRIELKLSQR
jgi:chemotaxis protein MotB